MFSNRNINGIFIHTLIFGVVSYGAEQISNLKYIVIITLQPYSPYVGGEGGSLRYPTVVALRALLFWGFYSALNSSE